MEQKRPFSLDSHFERVLESVPSRVFAVKQSGLSNRVMAVAYSGGLDSTVLLYLASAYAAQKAVSLFAFHVHHGLNAGADDWLEHCYQTSLNLGIQFDSKKVDILRESGESIEALARQKRYEALVGLCQKHHVDLLLTAHHEDDQIETILMQLLRGTGTAGLSGMTLLGSVPEVQKSPAPYLLRPLLTVSRQELENWAHTHNVKWVEDYSNSDIRYARNAIRREIVPVLSRFFPGFRKNIIRNARHMQSARRLLNVLAEMDWEACRDGDKLNIVKMARLDHDRFDNLFRFWLSRFHLQMPSTGWLNEARKQLLEARGDAQVRLQLDGIIIRRYRQHLLLQKDAEKTVLPPLPVSFVWKGESALYLESFGGKLLFEPAMEGIDAKWLKTQSLSIHGYYGKEMLKASHDRPGRLLKLHYQEKGIPAWERQRLPLLYAGKELLFAAGIGVAVKHVKTGHNCVRIQWQNLDEKNTD